MIYKIIHLEDDPNFSVPLERAAHKEGVSYLGLPCLQALEHTLEDSGAEVFIVDGRFPRVLGGEVLDLAPEAIGSIRKRYPQAEVFLYSSGMNAETVASQNHVGFYSKSVLARELVTDLKKRFSW